MLLNRVRAGLPVTIVMYHSIRPVTGRYTISSEAFRRQLAAICRRFSIIRLKQLGDLSSVDASRRHVAITFDDAFTDFVEFAFPVIQEFGVPSTVFVPTRFIGRTNEWDHPFDQCQRKRIMDHGTLRDLKESGLVDFGSHSVDHVRMSTLHVDVMRRQAIDSKRTLEDVLSEPIEMFAYPYGQPDDYSRVNGAVLSEAGFKIAVTTLWSTRVSPSALLTCGRVYFDETDGDGAVGRKIEGLHVWRRPRMQLGAGCRMVRRALSVGRPARVIDHDIPA